MGKPLFYTAELNFLLTIDVGPQDFKLAVGNLGF